jgi:adenylate kinase
MSSLRLVFLGAPGAGKGTQAADLAKSCGVPHLSTGDMLRKAVAERSAVGLKVEPILASGKLVPDEVMWAVVSERLDKKDCVKGFLLDGFPRTLAQGERLAAKLADGGTPLSCAVFFDVPEDELVRRMLLRGRADDTPDVVKERLRNYERETAPLTKWYGSRGLLRSVNGTGSPAEVHARIRAAVGLPPR